VNTPRLACGDRSFPLAPFELSLDLIQGLGFQAADLYVSARSRHLPLAAVLESPVSLAEKIATLLESRTLAAADVLLDLPDGMDAQFDELLAFAEQCGSRHATLRIQPAVETALLERFAAAAMARGVTPAIQGGGLSPAQTAEALDAVNGLTLSLDYGHFLVQGCSEEEVNQLLPRVSHVHARGVASGAFQVAWTENAINWKRTLKMLEDRNYDGFVAAAYLWEPEHGWNRNDTIGETAAMKRALLQAL
jgi:sugar phosphate isomerase/epimerase